MSVQRAFNGPRSADKSAGDARRKAELGKIHLGKKQLGMEDGDYRDMLERVAGVRSAAGLDGRGRYAVLEEMKRLGFKDAPRRQPKRAGRRPIAEGEMQGKIRALWLSLYHLGEVGDPSEAALAAFCARMTKRDVPGGVQALQWLDGHTANMAILALRGWCARVGFTQPNAEEVALIDSWRHLAKLPASDTGFAAKVTLIRLLWKRLAAAGAFDHPVFADLGTWCSTRFGVAAPHFLSADDADRAIEQLGKWLRKKQGSPQRHGGTEG